MDREREMIELQRQQLLQERQQYQFEQVKSSESKSRATYSSSSHLINGSNDLHLQSEESMDSQQSDGISPSSAQLLSRNEGKLKHEILSR